MIAILSESAGDAPAVEALLDEALGPRRRLKTVERLREGRAPAEGLALVAVEESRLVGTVRLWPVAAGDRPALLLGPVAVREGWRGRGVGRALAKTALKRAALFGHGAVILVGDPGYYGRFGFRRETTRGLSLPGPVEIDRFLGIELVAGALAGAAGPVRAAGAAAASARNVAPLSDMDADERRAAPGVPPGPQAALAGG